MKKDNSKEDFAEYENDPLFKDIIRKLDQSVLWEKVNIYGMDFFDMGRKEGLEEGEKKKSIEIAKRMLLKKSILLILLK